MRGVCPHCSPISSSRDLGYRWARSEGGTGQGTGAPGSVGTTPQVHLLDLDSMDLWPRRARGRLGVEVWLGGGSPA